MKYHITITLAFIFLLFSCRSKKTTTEKETIVKTDTVYQEATRIDTLRITETKEVTKPVYFETEIPCNEDQSGTAKSGNNIFNYKIKDGKIQFDFKLDSTECLTRKEYRSQFKNDSLSIVRDLQKNYTKTEKVKVYVYPWWVWLLGVGLVVFAALWVYQKFFIPRI